MPSIRDSGTFTVQTSTSATDTWNGDNTLNYTMTGSNATADIKNIPSGSWTPLNTSSLSDIKYAFFDNMGTGSVSIASNSTGTSVLTKLLPNDNSRIAWDGPLSLYANTYSGSGGTLLKYILAES